MQHNSKTNEISPQKLWRKLFKKTFNSGVLIPIIYCLTYFTVIFFIKNISLKHFLFFIVGCIVSLLDFIIIFKSKYQVVDKNFKPYVQENVKPKRDKPIVTYPIVYDKTNDLNIVCMEYKDYVDYYKKTGRGLTYVSSVKKLNK